MRRSGRTTTQIKNAKLNALFITAESKRYVIDLCFSHKRNDLRIMSVRDLIKGGPPLHLRGLCFSEIVVDHGVNERLSSKDRNIFENVLAQLQFQVKEEKVPLSLEERVLAHIEAHKDKPRNQIPPFKVTRKEILSLCLANNIPKHDPAMVTTMMGIIFEVTD